MPANTPIAWRLGERVKGREGWAKCSVPIKSAGWWSPGGDHIGSPVLRLVHCRGNGETLRLTGSVGEQVVLQCLRVRPRIKPLSVVAWCQNDRHTVVNTGGEFVGVGEWSGTADSQWQ